MPIILRPRAKDGGNQNARSTMSLQAAVNSGNVKRYRYRSGVNLTPGTELHDLLRDEIMARANASHEQMSARFDSWNKVDEQLTAYMDLSAYDKDEKGSSVQDTDPNKPVSIVVPVSYAILDTLLTHLTASFLDLPHFGYSGNGPEDELGAMLMEQVVMAQNAKSRTASGLHTMFRDALVYGIGPIAPTWTTKMAYRRLPEPVGFIGRAAGFIKTGLNRRREEFIKFEGTTIHNIDPYTYLPDVSVSAGDISSMEYVGYLRKETYHSLLSQERTDATRFNARYLEYIDGTSSLQTDESKRDRDGVDQERGDTVHNRVDVIYMYVTLIPDQWGLGPEVYPQDWLFGLAGDEVIIAAAPLGLDHNEKPVLCYAPDYDGYSAAPISKMESMYGLQHLVNFLYNSHVANVRKAINDMLVVDPELVNINDVMNPAPGKVIRLRKRAWGKGITGAIDQLKVTDITGSHLTEGSLIMQLVQNFSGATDSLQGATRRGGERVSATEFRGTQLAALSRLEKAARVAGFQVMGPLGEQMAYNNQQFMTQDMWLELKGRNEEDLRAILGAEGLEPDERRVQVSPEDLLVAFDILVNDGSLPNQGDPQLWSQMLQVVSTQPELAQELDSVRIFKHWARISGAKNVQDFLRRRPNAAPRVVSDDEAEDQRQRGNFVPLSEATR